MKVLPFENYSLSTPTLPSENNRTYSKNVQKKYVCLNEVIWLMTIKMRLKMKSWSHTIKLDLGLDMDINILYIKCVSV